MFTGWYPHLGQQTKVLGCTAPNNYIHLGVESGEEYIVHSCLNLRLSLKVNGEAESVTHIILLVANTVVIEEIISKGVVKIYSDAKSTYLGKIQAPAVDLNAPGGAYIQNGSYIDLDLSMTGPEFVELANSVMTNSSVTFISIKELMVTNSQFKQVKWTESVMLKKLDVRNNSKLDLTLITCVEQNGFTYQHIKGRVYCSDTLLRVSGNSKVRFTYLVRKEYFSQSLLFNDNSEQYPSNCTANGN